jgi:hypothetical protein
MGVAVAVTVSMMPQLPATQCPYLS